MKESLNTTSMSDKKEAKEYPMSIKREELDAVLNDPKHTHEDVLALFEKDLGHILDKSSGVNEGYTIRKHTGMVMGQYEKYFKGKELTSAVDPKFFEVILALHDIGKPEAIEKAGDKEKQHEYTQKIMNSVFPQLGYSEREISIANALIEGDPIGDFLQRGDANKNAEEIVGIAGRYGIDKKDFFKLLTVLFTVDASSYTTDAGGSETSATNKVFSFDPRERSISLAPETKRLYRVLEEKVEKLNYEDILNKKVSENPKEEAYDFSKEFSKRGRNELAAEIKRMRREYMKDLPAENVRRAEKRAALSEIRDEYESRITKAERDLREAMKEQKEWMTAQEELKQIKEGIEKRKTSVWYKVQKMFGGGKDLAKKQTELSKKQPEIGRFDEYRVTRAEEEKRSAETGRPMIEYYDRQIARVEDVIIDEAWHDKAKARISEFYGKQSEIRNEFEKDRADRGIQENVKKHNVLFLHGLPFEVQQANTSANNQLINIETMAPEDKARFLAGFEPAISVSSKTLDPELAEKLGNQKELMYDAGFIIGDGEIMSAYKNDEGTIAESLDIKGTKFEPSSIQTNIAENIARSIGAEDRTQKINTWNELVVRNPKAAGMFIMEGSSNEARALPRVQKLAEEMHIPVIRISRDGKMFNLTENRETTKEEVMAGTKNFSTEEKIGFIEETKRFIKGDVDPKTSAEIQKRLDTLKKEKTVGEQKDEDMQREIEVRSKLEETLSKT